MPFVSGQMPIGQRTLTSAFSCSFRFATFLLGSLDLSFLAACGSLVARAALGGAVDFALGMSFSKLSMEDCRGRSDIGRRAIEPNLPCPPSASFPCQMTCHCELFLAAWASKLVSRWLCSWCDCTERCQSNAEIPSHALAHRHFPILTGAPRAIPKLNTKRVT